MCLHHLLQALVARYLEDNDIAVGIQLVMLHEALLGKSFARFPSVSLVK